ncbi:MAG: class I SAM-dependent methyltransferase [bacterium]
MSRTPEWPVAFFDDDYLRIYRPHFTAERTDAETRFIADSLAAPAGAEVLDLACGFGRHAIGMARRGYRVTGLDFNPSYLAIAAADARAAGVEVDWRAGDMRDLGVANAFDAVYSYFTSFGYFDDEDNERVLAEVARVLRPRGRFLLEMANRDHTLTHPQQRTWTQREDGALLMEETELELASSRVVTRQMLLDPKGGASVTKQYSIRTYTCAELSALLRRHGFDVLAVTGGTDGEAYGTASRRLAIVAERRG